MSASTSRFTILFKAVGTADLKKVRNVLRGVEQQSYTSLNAFNRNMSSMEKNTIRSLNNVDKRLAGFGKSLRMFSMAGIGLTAISAGFGALVGGIAMANRAFISTNSQMQTSKILIEELLGNRGSAKEFVSVMQNLSASFGVDMAETMNSSRGMLQVMKQVGKGDVKPKDLERMLKMTMAIGAMDIENRGLSYTAFSIKEAFQGLGQGDFRSLRNRLEINLGRPVEQAITKALKAGDLDKAINLFDEGLKRIGINSDKLLKRLNSEGFVQNLSRLQAYITRSFQLVGEKMYYSLTTPFYKLNNFLERQFQEGGRGGKILAGLGNSLYDGFQPALEKISEIGKELYNNREEISKSLSSMIYSFAKLGKSSGTMFLSFFKGLFGVKSDSKSQIKDMITLMQTLSNFSNKLSTIFNKLTPVLKGVGKAVHDIISEIGKIAVNTGLAKAGGGLVGLAGGIATIVGEGIAGILSTINSIIGNVYNDPNKPNGGGSNMLQNGANLAIMGSILIPLLTRGRKGNLSSTGGTNGSIATAEAQIASKTGIGELEKLKLSNTRKMYDIDNKMSSTLPHYKNLDINKATAQFMGERLVAKSSTIQSLQQAVVERRAKLMSVEEKAVKKYGREYFEQNVKTGSKYKKIQEEIIAKESTIAMYKEEYARGSMLLNQKMNEIKIGKEYNTLMEERNSLLKKNMAIENVGNKSTSNSIFSKLPSLESTMMATMIGSFGISILKGIGDFFKGGVLTKLGSIVNSIVGKLGLLSIGLVSIVGAFKLSSDRLDAIDQQIEDNEVQDHNNRMTVVKLRKKQQFNDFMNKHGFSAKNINTIYDKGAGGQAPNPTQIAMLHLGKTGATFQWGKSIAEENKSREIILEAIRNRTITAEGAKGILSDNAINALFNQDNINATMEANLQLSGMSPQMMNKFETMMSNAMIKAIKAKGNSSGLEGVVDDPNLRIEAQLKSIGQYGIPTEG